MMGSPSNIYLIKDLSRRSGQSIHTLKFYLKLGLIQERGRSPETQFRYFDDATLQQLAAIRAWQKEKKSLAEIKRLLTEKSGAPSRFLPSTVRKASARPTDQ